MKHRSGVFVVNFEHISHVFLAFLLLTLSMYLLALLAGRLIILSTCRLVLNKVQRMSKDRSMIVLHP